MEQGRSNPPSKVDFPPTDSRRAAAPHGGHPFAPADTLFDGLPLPICLLDGAGHLVALNRFARRFWGWPLDAHTDQPAMEALGIVPTDGGDAWARLSPAGARRRLPCRLTLPDGRVLAASVLYIPLEGTMPPLGALLVIEGERADLLSDLPDWALRDPVTGLGNRHRWEAELPSWASRAGCVAFFDLDDLKEVNDLHGHVAGDRTLRAVGQALALAAPRDALLVRYGGDEFVVVLPTDDQAVVEVWARDAVQRVATCAATADLPIVPRLSHGEAAFGPGGLAAAVQRADDLLYERKGVLLRAASGARIILTRQGRVALRGPGDDRLQPPGAFSASFSPDFDTYLRAQYVRALDQARDFVAFAEVAAGEAVVEVGAGAGRITFDGGLAERIGPTGQLLVTDPSGSSLQGARERADRLGLDWVRFIRAPAEDLPLASGTTDLVLGAFFLQFTYPEPALRELARLVRPGGRLALSCLLHFTWPAPWHDILAPVAEALAPAGLPLRPLFPAAGWLRQAVADTGLLVEREITPEPERANFPDPDIAIGFWRQNGLVSLLLRDAPALPRAPIQDAFEARLRAVFARTEPAERVLTVPTMMLVARKPREAQPPT